ncbi:MAG: F0F1 ATP synthase subunit B, partial [Stellaceae bacterium]
LMPHLFRDPEFWVLVAVLVFIAIVWKPGRRSLLGGLDARATRIRDELEAARSLREEAERALAAYQRKAREAAAEAEAIIAHARAEAERLATQSARDLEEMLQRRRRLAEERIAQEQAKALAEIRAIAVDIAISAARWVIAAELNKERGAMLIDSGIAALPHQLQ